jgi:hypothetical protein
MEVPREYAWGVDIAIMKLRPGCSFSLGGSTISDWQDPSGQEPPTWEEVMQQVERDRVLAENWLKSNQE